MWVFTYRGTWSRRVASHRIASHREEGERASGGGSATSVAARCSKTGPLRMRASSSLHRVRRATEGRWRCRLLIPSCPTCQPGASVAREPSTCGGVSPRSACATAALSFFLSLSYTHALPRLSSPNPRDDASLPLVIIITRLHCRSSWVPRRARNRYRGRVIAAKLVVSECTSRRDAARWTFRECARVRGRACSFRGVSVRVLFCVQTLLYDTRWWKRALKQPVRAN